MLIGPISCSVYISRQVRNKVIPAVTASESVASFFLAITDTVAYFAAVTALDLDNLALDFFLLAAGGNVAEFWHWSARNDKERASIELMETVPTPAVVALWDTTIERKTCVGQTL